VGVVHVLEVDEEVRAHGRLVGVRRLGSHPIATSEIEAPNIFAIPV
jgi:hypothetical protein